MKRPEAKALRKSARITILIFAFLFLALSIYQIFKVTGSKKKVRTTLYNCLISADCSYQVILKKNDLFPEGVLEENRIYPLALVDRAEILFRAEYAGSGKADVTGDYTIEAVLQGYKNNGDEQQTVYEKHFPLIDHTTVNETGALKISESVSVDPASYKKTAEQANAILGLQVPANLKVTMSGTFHGDSKFGKVEKPFRYSLDIPLENSLYTIKKPNPVSIQDSITETKTGLFQWTPKSFLPAVLLFLLAAAMFGILAFHTRRPTPQEQHRMDMQKLIRTYGSRMVRLTQMPSAADMEQIVITDPDSLIRLSDDLQRPIYYCPDDEGLPRNDLFCLFENHRCYLLHQRAADTMNTPVNGHTGGSHHNTTFVP